jgi:hypothetical protein
MSVKVRGKSLYWAFSILWFFALVCVLVQPAYAYVDPGSGLLLYQLTGSLFTGILFLLRRRVRKLFGRFIRDSTAAAELRPDDRQPEPLQAGPRGTGQAGRVSE